MLTGPVGYSSAPVAGPSPAPSLASQVVPSLKQKLTGDDRREICLLHERYTSMSQAVTGGENSIQYFAVLLLNLIQQYLKLTEGMSLRSADLFSLSKSYF